MGLFSRIKGAASSKVNAAIDAATDPARALDLHIADLEETHTKALAELVSYRATVKVMEQDIARLTERAEKLEQRAMAAVRGGDDDLARRCLKEVRETRAELERAARDRDEISGHAVQLNRSRKALEPRLKMLKMRKGTLSLQIAAARAGTDGPLGVDHEPFDRLDAVERRIDEDAAIAEVAAALAEGGTATGAGNPAATASLEGRLLAAEASAGGQDALAELKARMAADQARSKK